MSEHVNKPIIFAREIPVAVPKENMGKEHPAWLRADADTSPTYLTGRAFMEVKRGLLIPDNFFPPGSCALSIGEGLSDFARKLHQDRGVDIIAVDPLYALGKDILQKDPEKIRKALEKRYGTRIQYDPNVQQDPQSIPLPDPTRIVAAEIQHLPFSDASFDRIISVALFQHVDFAKALPEMLRVLRTGGEIRSGALDYWVDTKEKRMLDKSLKRSKGKLVPVYPKGDLHAVIDYIADHPDLHAYTVLSLPPKGESAGPYLTSQTLIIRNDTIWPEVLDYKPSGQSGERASPLFGKVMEINPRDVEIDDFGLRKYALTEQKTA